MLDIELTNMVMIQNPENNEVLVQRRKKYWCGLSFPGGHIERNESFVDSAVREVKEETGLDIKNVRFCGFINWDNKDTGKRYVVLCYKTNSFSGELIKETDEGEVFWIHPDDLQNEELSPNFDKYIKLFMNDCFDELYYNWAETEEKIGEFK